jgi:hypothetical protein
MGALHPKCFYRVRQPGGCNCKYYSLLQTDMDVTDVPLQDKCMQLVVRRIKSYDCWPLSFIDTQEMGAAGLYYTGYEDVRRFPFCKNLFMYWTVGDHPFCKHRGQVLIVPTSRHRGLILTTPYHAGVILTAPYHASAVVSININKTYSLMTMCSPFHGQPLHALRFADADVNNCSHACTSVHRLTVKCVASKL